MALTNLFFKMQDLAKPDSDPTKGKAFDNPGYEKALKGSGYTHEEATEYWAPRRDPFSRESISDIVSAQAPTVSVKDNSIHISAPQEFLNSPMAEQLKKQLEPLKWADLSNPGVTNVINKLNDEIHTSYSNTIVNDVIGWSPDDFATYQKNLQTVSKTNPMSSSDPIVGLDKNGNIIKMSFRDWVEYYKKNYTTQERSDAYLESVQSNSPYGRTMALVLGAGPGGRVPVYGFSAEERIGQGWEAFVNQLGKFPEGALRFIGEDNTTRRVEGLVSNKNIPVESMRKFNVNNEEQFNAKKESLEGKSWSELSDDDKAFLVLLGASREGGLERKADTSEAMKEYRGRKTNTFAWDTYRQDYERAKRRAARKIGAEDLNNAVSDDDNTSRDAILKILSDNSFDKYKTARNNYDTWQGYEDWTNESEERLARNAIWSGTEQLIGNFAGTIGRFLWEDAVLRGLTGGLSMNRISDKLADSVLKAGSSLKTTKLGASLVNGLAGRGVSITSPFAKNAIKFTASLVGTIPEDILQTAVDNVITYNADENANLLNPDEMSQNFKNNLIFMSIFNAARAGVNSVRLSRMAKQAAKQADLSAPLNIDGIVADADDISRAINKGGQFKVDTEKVSVEMPDGTETVYKNIDQEKGELIQASLFDQGRYTVEELESIAPERLRGVQDIEGFREFVKNYGDGRVDINNIEPTIEAFRRSKTIDLVNDADNDQFLKKTTGEGTDQVIKEIDTGETQSEYSPINDKVGISIDGEISSEAVKSTIFHELSHKLWVRMPIGLRIRVAQSLFDSLGLRVAVDDAIAKSKAMNELIAHISQHGYDLNNGSGRFMNIDEAQKYIDEIAKYAGVEPVSLREMGDTLAGYLRSPYGKKISGVIEVEDFNDFHRGIAEGQFIDDFRRNVDSFQENMGNDKVTYYENEYYRRLADGGESGLPKMGGDIDQGPGIQPRVSDTADTVKVDVDTPDGTTRVDVTDYRPRNLDESLKMKIDATPAGTQHAQRVQLDAIMNNDFRTHMDNFRNNFGDVQVSDFDWVLWNTRQGLTPEQIIGTVDPTTGREVTQNMIDAMKWWSEQPAVKNLREASRGALGLEGDFDMLGYLPHTDYDPTNMSFDEVLAPGVLWQRSTGASMMDDVGNYKGFGGDFESRYRTFASNMLWDTKSEAVAAARLIEEAQMDGVKLSEPEAQKIVEGEKEIRRQKVDDVASTKELDNALLSDTDSEKIDWDAIEKQTAKDAIDNGLGQAYHDNYGPMFMGSNTASVTGKTNTIARNFDTLGNNMRKIEITTNRGQKMNMYDSGGADIVYSDRNAIDVMNRFSREGGGATHLKEILVDFVINHSRRSPEYAEYVADKWMAKLGDLQAKGQLTKATAIKTLGTSMKYEGYNRFRRFLALAKYDEFNSATKKTIDNFLFRHMQTDSMMNNQKIISKLGKTLDVLTGLRYRALFYGNFKNALLQTTELNRFYSAFKWGDVAKMAKRMATDATFRARVDGMVEAVAPMTSRMKAELYQAYSEVANSAKVTKDGTVFRNVGEKAKDVVDKIGLASIETAEAFKNRMIVAGLVQEADSLGLAGDDALRHIRRRFERVALAMDEMGQIGIASSPLGRTALFLQNFQIRELGMHIHNIIDEWNMGKTVPKQALNATKYITKVLGAKAATALIMARLGYSASQSLGIDPFGLLENNYTGVDDEELEGFDYFMKSPLFAGGMTSVVSDIYFMMRKAYEESNPKTISEEAEESLSGESSWGISGLSFDELMGVARGFIPGNVFANRLNQMNEMMDAGWAISSTGNKMYTAPDDALNTILGYSFGRSATQNAQQYNQTYGDNLWQTLGRVVTRPFAELSEPFGGSGYQSFDPIDTKNYTDWFKGDDNDAQQFNKGRYYFQGERDRIINEYRSRIENKYISDEERAEARNNMNLRLEELFNQLERFVTAYEKKNGTISPNMVKQILDILNTSQEFIDDTEAESSARDKQGYQDALRRYSELGLPAIGTYSGPTESNPEQEVYYQGSPQYRAAVQSYKGQADEAAAVLKEADKQLQPIRKQIQQAYSDAMSNKDWNSLGRIQRAYLDKFDEVVAPIIAMYGNSILSNTNVEDQLRDMLSTGTNTRSANLIPSSQYSQNKYGRNQSMPYQDVDVAAWAQQRFRSDTYKNPTNLFGTTGSDDIIEIKQLISKGSNARAMAKALQLKVNLDNRTKTLSQSDWEWLSNYLKGGGK